AHAAPAVKPDAFDQPMVFPQQGGDDAGLEHLRSGVAKGEEIREQAEPWLGAPFRVELHSPCRAATDDRGETAGVGSSGDDIVGFCGLERVAVDEVEIAAVGSVLYQRVVKEKGNFVPSHVGNPFAGGSGEELDFAGNQIQS